MSISAVVLTKNEEAKIRRCLDSLKSFVNEIIVVDDESSDQTVTIVEKEYDAIVIRRASRGNFDMQRNLGADRAIGPWILQLDADEVIPFETAEIIQRTAKTPSSVVAWKILKRDCIFETPLKHLKQPAGIKLYKKGSVRYIGHNVHETLEIKGYVGYLQCETLHYCTPSFHELFSKYNFYSSMEAKGYMEEKSSISLRFIKNKLLFKSPRLFFKHYFKNKAYKDGLNGFIWAILNTLLPFLVWLKVLEIAIKEKKLVR